MQTSYNSYFVTGLSRKALEVKFKKNIELSNGKPNNSTNKKNKTIKKKGNKRNAITLYKHIYIFFFCGYLFRSSETGKVLTTMQAGDFFGEIGILNLDGLNK